MIERSEAIGAVEALLQSTWHPAGSEEVVVRAQAYPGCWAISAQSRAWVESGDVRDMLIGRGVFIVDKATGEVHETGSGQSEELSVERFEEWGDPYGPPPLDDASRDLLGRIAAGSGRHGTRALSLYARARGVPWADRIPELAAELDRRGLTVETDGRWSLTDAGYRMVRASDPGP